MGQIIGVVTADSQWAAIEGARKVQVQYEDLPPILSISDAIEQGSFYPGDRSITDGDAKGVLAGMDESKKVRGDINIGGQVFLSFLFFSFLFLFFF